MVDVSVELSGPGAELAKEVAGGSRGALRHVFGPALTEFGEMLGDQNGAVIGVHSPAAPIGYPGPTEMYNQPG